MSSHFAHTLRSLEHGERRLGWLWACLALLGAWGLWFGFARVDVYASARRARLEVNRITHRVAFEEGGRIAELHCELGRSVREGDLLVGLDTTLARAERAQVQAELEGLAARREALERQIAAQRSRAASKSRIEAVANARAGLALEQARQAAAQRQELAQIADSLWQENASSRVDALNANRELQRELYEVSGASLEMERLEAARDYDARAEHVLLAELERQLIGLETERWVKSAALETAEMRLRRARVLAPASGRLGKVVTLQVGDVVSAGDVIATVIPEVDVHVVAEFAPEVAVGRVLPGQSARLRCEGFSWLQFGMLDATVTRVADEPEQHGIRVELALVEGQRTRIPLQHGLPGSVDVQVERVAPWVLLRRSIGQALLPSAADPRVSRAAQETAGGEPR